MWTKGMSAFFFFFKYKKCFHVLEKTVRTFGFLFCFLGAWEVLRFSARGHGPSEAPNLHMGHGP